MRRALIALIALSVVWALAIALTGGIDLRPYGIGFKSTDPDRAAYLLLALLLIYVAAYRGHARDHATWFEELFPPLAGLIDRRATAIAIGLSVLIFVLGYQYGVLVAGGSDSYGYISQADLWLAGDLIVEQPIARQVPWPDGGWSFAPLGYRPTDDGSAIVPTYSYGLPVLMAAAKLVAGICGVYLVTPLLGALMVGMTYVLGLQVWSRRAGVAAATLMATSPAFLFMLMNPMSDVPVSGLFTAALVVSLARVRGAAFWSGVLVSLAIFVRPNLVPLGALFVAWFVASGETWRQRIGSVVWFGVGGFPLIAVIAVTNAVVFGAPWNSGYGSLDVYYAWNYLVPNISQFGSWLVSTETPFVILLAVPLALIRRLQGEQRARLVFVAVFAASIWVAYVFYTPYDAWWYLRFLLPAFPPMLVLAVVGLRQLLASLPESRRVLACTVVLLVVLAVRVHRVDKEGIFSLWESGAVYTSAAEYIRKELPANAVILTVQHSGSVRHYADRLTARWDWIGADWWPRALDVLRELGYRPYLLISRFEEAQLRKQFGFGEAEDGPGTVIADFPTPFGVVLYDPLRQAVGPRETMPTIGSCPCGFR